MSSDRHTDVEPEKRLADPDNYNLRRRLRQLHDAREYVKEVKNQALNSELSNPRQSNDSRDRAVAEAVTDYATELLPVLRRREHADEFRSEDVGDGELTIGEFIDTRGAPEATPLRYTLSMKVWSVCNEYFERVAGPEFENESLPRETGFETTGARDESEE